MPDTRPDRDALGFLTAYLYARADEARVPRELVDASVEFVIRNKIVCKVAFEMIIDEALRTATQPPKDGTTNDQDGHGR